MQHIKLLRHILRTHTHFQAKNFFSQPAYISNQEIRWRKLSLIIDRYCMTICINYFIIYGYTFTIYYLFTIFSLLTLVFTYFKFIYKNKLDEAYLLHSILHLISNLGIVSLIYGCREEKCNLINQY